MKLICFDLEGPLSPQDNAYEVMGLIPDGHRLFEVISRYDDLLALEGREGYEPGDTLKLILPFLLYHGVSSDAILEVSRRAGLVQGAKELVAELVAGGWEVYIVSTSYEPHARNIGRLLGVPEERIFCTELPLDELRREVRREELFLLAENTSYILDELYSEDLGDGAKDAALKPYLDRFYWEKLPGVRLGAQALEMSVVGGRRKLWAMERIARKEGCFLEDMAFVGDSITDARACQGVEAAGGLAIAFNGNHFVLPYATVGLASTDLGHLEPLLRAWEAGARAAVKAWVEGGRAKVRAVVETTAQQLQGADSPPYYHWLVGRSGRELEEVISVHRKMRHRAREEAGRLG